MPRPEIEQAKVLGPQIRKQSGDVYAPYQEQKERIGPVHFDVAVVFGEGPIKDIRFLSELSDQEKTMWDTFTASPRSQAETPFYVIDDLPHGTDPQSSLDKNPYFNMMNEIRTNDTLSLEGKQLAIEARRLEWQRMGQYGMRRWGEFNALATGLALYLDMADRFILTGGRTMSKDQEAALQKKFLGSGGDLEDTESWQTFVKQQVPSEAALMRDLVLRRFGKLMFYRDIPREQLEASFNVDHPMEKTNLSFAEFHPTDELQADYERRLRVKEEREAERKHKEQRGEFVKRIPDEYPLTSFGDYLEGRRGSYRYKQYLKFEKDKYQEYVDTYLIPRLILEDEALTTPENIVYSVNKNPELFTNGKKVAVITNDHHVPRASEFLHLFGGVTSEIGQISAQRLLHQRAEIRSNELYAELMHYFYADTTNNPDLEKKQQVDIEKTARLKMPEQILYWIGHIGMLEDASRIQSLLDETRQRDNGDPKWTEALSLAFNEAGLMYSNREEDRDNPENLYYQDIADLEKRNPELYAKFKQGMTELVEPAKRDSIFRVENGHLVKP